MRTNKEYSQAVTQAKENLADMNERGADAVGGDVLEFMESILTPEEIAESELRVSIIGELIKARQEKGISQKKLEDIIQRIVALAGREVNQANPIVDTRLPDGSRVNVVLPPIALCGPTVTIRKFSKTPMTMEQLIKYGSITKEIADKLEILIKAKFNIFISGGTG